MSRMEELIKRECPKGVEYKTIESVVKVMSPSIKIKSNDYLDEGKYPVIDQGQSFIGGYTNEGGAFPIDEYVIFGDHTCVVKYVDFEFVQGADGVKVLKTNKNIILPRYLYHCMTSIRMIVNYARHWSKMKAKMIPVPPISIQQEIIVILDKLVSLESGLKKELTLRRIQYEYYRDKIVLSADEEVAKLSDICTIKGRIGFRGYTQEDFVEKGNGAISLSPGNIVNNHIVYNDCKYITWEKYEESPEIMLSENDVVVCKTGSTVGKVALVDDLPEKTTLNPQLVVLKDIKCNYRYLYYVLASSSIQYRIKGLAGVGSVPNISQKVLGDIEFNLPNLEKQNRIVKILDTMDIICNDLKLGLPAEIEARHKQYEHYRDRLLSFERGEE